MRAAFSASRCAGAARTNLRVGVQRSQARQLSARAAGGPVAPPTVAGSDNSSSGQPSWTIKMLYDGDCPLCMREVEMLMRRDEGKGRIAFVDIASPDYSPEQNGGITFEQAMERIHAIEADGRVITDVEVFRRLYEEVGLGWVYAITKNKTVEQLANKVYDVWAKYRLPITGRPDLAVVLQEKKACGAAKDGSSCELP
ncbi:hypothetical protein ABPG77_006622 [Micractinium sp. CCAP 211/92]